MTIAAGPSVSAEANASRRGDLRIGVAVQSCQSVMLPPMCVSQKTRRPDVETDEIPKPPLGPSSQPRIVRSPNVQRPRVAVSHSRTEPQFALVAPTAHMTERPVTESAVTGAAFVTVRPGRQQRRGGAAETSDARRVAITTSRRMNRMMGRHT